MLTARADIPSDRRPVVTLLVILASVVVLAITGLDGGVLALLSAVLFAWLGGPPVEDALRRPRTVALVAGGAGVGAALEALVGPSALVPLAAVTGASAVLVGAALALYPWGRVLGLLPVPLFVTLLAVPLPVVFAVWAVIQAALALWTDGVNVAVPFGAALAGILVARPLAIRVHTPESLLQRGRTALS